MSTPFGTGAFVPTAWPEIIREMPGSALVSGNWTFGHVAAKIAMEVAIEKAKKQNVTLVSLVQTHHVGRLGHYTEMAATQGMISMVWLGGYSPLAVPYGGKKRMLPANPVSIGFPAGEESPMIADFSTSATSAVKVMNAYNRNQSLPQGVIVDKHGNPSTDPKDYFEGGGLVPFGGHKGFALMMACEFLSSVFCGTNKFADPKRGGETFRNQGVTMIVFKSGLFQPKEYPSLADDLERRIRSCPPAPGFEEVLVPGDPEARARAIRQRDGIPIHDDVWQSILEAADALGITDI